jgi:replication-associated recombination protein RarA
MLPLYESWRPKSWSDVVGQDRACRQIAVLRRRGLIGRVFWITAHSGQGKTTIARLIAEEIADDYAVIEIDAQDVGLDKCRQFEEMCRFKPIGKGCHVFIINEAHTMSSKVVSRLQTVLETPCVQSNSTWIFTTTLRGQRKLFDGAMDAEPVLSRAVQITLSHGPELELAFAIRAREIAQAEDLDGKPLEDYVALAKECKCNMRRILQRIEAGDMLGD